jgi:hypothetical protein
MTHAEIAATFTTTAREAAASGVGVSAEAASAAAAAQKTLIHTPFAPAAGGVATVRHDRGKRTIGNSDGIVAGAENSAARTWM